MKNDFIDVSGLRKLRLVNQVTQENPAKVVNSTKIRLLRFRKKPVKVAFAQMLLSLKGLLR